jgi:phosphopantothenoylcysteine decarboxylase / phosphopantothenate---cysteine ligase
MMTLAGKHIVVGVGGGIAAFKAVELVRELTRRGAKVRVAMTESATRFVGPVTFAGITGFEAVTDLWNPSYPGEAHVELAEWADALVIAPATANLLARAAHGLADDAVLATFSCATCPKLMAPAMHERMWLSPGNQRGLEQLRNDGVRFVGPVEGALANGKVGMGRLAEPIDIADALQRDVLGARDLNGITLLISAGPTQEDLDPVRFISNRSTGRMGYAIASAARDRGANVVLVTGPTTVPVPRGMEVLHVRSALEMQGAIESARARADVIVMTAAVADYRPAEIKPSKLKKHGDTMTVELVKNPDILATLGHARTGKRPVLVGFAMETDNLVAYARKKLVEKKVDLIIANEAAIGFGRDDTQATLVDAKGEEPLPPTSKTELAHRILDRIKSLL